jgi:hypothetical protein
MIIRSIKGIRANRGDKAPLISLRYCRQCKPDFEAFAHEPPSLGSGFLHVTRLAHETAPVFG